MMRRSLIAIAFVALYVVACSDVAAPESPVCEVSFYVELDGERMIYRTTVNGELLNSGSSEVPFRIDVSCPG